MGHHFLKRVIPLSLGAIALLAVNALPASAQATRTWVSGLGDDANPCSRTAPCKTFPGAISRTAAGGEINVLDPGGFGGVTIGKSITIKAVGVEAGVLVSGSNGITINGGPADVVNLEGLDFICAPPNPCANGVQVNGGALIHIHNSTIRNFGTGINVSPTAGNTGPSYVLVTDTILDNNKTGVLYMSSDATAKAVGTLDHVTIFGTGVNQGGIGVSVAGADAVAVLKNSTIVRNQTGLMESAMGSLFSFGNNGVVTNQTNGTPNQSVTLE